MCLSWENSLDLDTSLDKIAKRVPHRGVHVSVQLVLDVFVVLQCIWG